MAENFLEDGSFFALAFNGSWQVVPNSIGTEEVALQAAKQAVVRNENTFIAGVWQRFEPRRFVWATGQRLKNGTKQVKSEIRRQIRGIFDWRDLLMDRLATAGTQYDNKMLAPWENAVEFILELVAGHTGEYDWRGKAWVFVFNGSHWTVPSYKGRAAYFHHENQNFGHFGATMSDGAKFAGELVWNKADFSTVVAVDKDGNFRLLDFVTKSNYWFDGPPVRSRDGMWEWQPDQRRGQHLHTWNSSHLLASYQVDNGAGGTMPFSIPARQEFDQVIQLAYPNFADITDLYLYRMNATQLRDTLLPAILMVWDEGGFLKHPSS